MVATPDVFLEGLSVTNIALFDERKILCTVSGENESGYFCVDLETSQAIRLDTLCGNYCFDIERVKSLPDHPVFICHWDRGIELLDPENQARFLFLQEDSQEYATPKTLASTLIDEKDPEAGFILTLLSVSDPCRPQIWWFNFDREFVEGLKKLV